MTDNLAIWTKATPVDPKFTKNFSRSGGFRGTATNSAYLVRRATEIFGPVGIGWGWDVIDERYAEGGPIMGAEGVVLCREVVHVLRVRLWYMQEGARREFEHYGQTKFVFRDKNGVQTDEEAPKKSLTDALSKALSCLGFASEIFLGLWDDVKHVRATVGDDLPKEQDTGKDDQQTNGKKVADVPAKPEHAERPEYAEFMKDTPAGKAWKVTAIQAAMRAFCHDLEGVTDDESLRGLIADNGAALDACALAQPKWWSGPIEGFEPINERISRKRLEIKDAERSFNPKRMAG